MGYLVAFTMGAVGAVGVLEARIWQYWETEAQNTIREDNARYRAMVCDSQRLSIIAAEARLKAAIDPPPPLPSQRLTNPNWRYAPANHPGPWVEATH